MTRLDGSHCACSCPPSPVRRCAARAPTCWPRGSAGSASSAPTPPTGPRPSPPRRGDPRGLAARRRRDRRGGRRRHPAARPDGSPVLGPAALGAADDLDLTRDTGRPVGAELAAAGVDLDLAPVADVNSNPDNPVIGTRSFGADPGRRRHVVAWLLGLQETGVAACVKHFPGHGDTAEDSHLALPTVDADLDVLAERELVPFAAAVEAGVAAVMTSHILVPALDPDLPATLSPRVLALLRERLGFDRRIVTDALDMAGACADGASRKPRCSPWSPAPTCCAWAPTRTWPWSARSRPRSWRPSRSGR